MNVGIGVLNMHADVDEIFDDKFGEEDEKFQTLHDKLSKRRQVEDILEKKRLRAELEDF